MKKTFLFLIVPFFCFAAVRDTVSLADSATNVLWSNTGNHTAGALPDNTDTCVINSRSGSKTISFDRKISVKRLIVESTHTKNVDLGDSSITVVNGLWLAGAGTKHCKGGITVTGDGALVSLATGPIQFPCVLDLQGNDTLNKQLNFTADSQFTQLKCAYAGKLTVIANSNSGRTCSQLVGGTGTLEILSGCQLTIYCDSVNPYIWTSTQPTINGGGGGIRLAAPYTAPQITAFNVPAITIGGTVYMTVDFDGKISDTVNQTGNILLTGGKLNILSSGSPTSAMYNVYNTNNYSISSIGGGGGIVITNNDVDDTITVNLGSSAITCRYFDLQHSATTGRIKINMGTSAWTQKGQTDIAGAPLIDLGTYRCVMDGSVINPATIHNVSNPYAIPFYKLEFNGSSKTFQNTDSLVVADSLIGTAGTYQQKAKGLHTKGHYYVGTGFTVVDTASTCEYDKDVNFHAAATITSSGTTVYRFTGAGGGAQKLTSTGHIISLIVHIGAQTLQPQDSLNCNNVLDSSTGTWDMDYGFRCTTAVWSAACSVAQSGAMENISNLSYGMQVKENITGTISFVGGVSGTFRDSGDQVADIINNKVGAGIGTTFIGRVKAVDGTFTDGTAWFTGGDTSSFTDLTFNNTGDSIAMSGTGTAVIVVAGNFSTAETVKWGSDIKILFTDCANTATLNGNTTCPTPYWPATTLSYASSPAVDTVGKAASHALTKTGCSTFDSITVTPALSPGLSISSSTGAITGTPTATYALTTYEVKSYKGAQIDSCNIVITIIPAGGRSRRHGNLGVGAGMHFGLRR